jgi:hypothetical protein
MAILGRPCPSGVPGAVSYTAEVLRACDAAGLIGAWRSQVARSVRDAEVGGSNPLAPTKLTDLTADLEDRG